MITAEILSEILSNHGVVLDTKKQLAAILKDIKAALKAPPGHVGAVYKAYCEAFHMRYGTFPPKPNGVVMGSLKRLVEEQGLERGVRYLQTYLQMNDSFFQLRRHDLSTFMNNLTAIHVRMETGKGVNQNDIRAQERRDTTRKNMRDFVEGDE